MFYGRTHYDPVYIIAQIASIQAIFYVTLGALLWVLVGKGTQCTICPCRNSRKFGFYPHCRAICWQTHPIFHLQQCLAQGWWLDGGAVELGDSCCDCHLYCNRCKYVWRICAFLLDTGMCYSAFTVVFWHTCRLSEPRSAWTSPSLFTSSTSWLVYAMLVFHITGNGNEPQPKDSGVCMLCIADVLFAHLPA